MSPRRLAPLAGLFLLALFVAPAMSPAVQLYYRDTGRLYYPVKLYIAQALARGELPLWDRMIEAGASILGQLTPGLFHPFTLLYLALPFDLAFKLNHLLALLIAGAGAYRLSRRLGATEWASLAAAVAYGGSGFLVSMAASNLPYALGAATVPVAVDALLAFLDRRSAGRLLWAAAALALSGYAGEPQSMLLAGVIGGVWAIVAGAGTGGLRGAARSAGLAAAWGALALCLVAPVALPAVAQLRRSTRFFGVTSEEQGMFANDPARLIGLFVPRAFDDVAERGTGPEARRGLSYFQEYFDADRPPFSDSIILGAPALLFALCGAWAGRRGRILLLGAAALALASTGQALGLDRALFLLVPPARLFRYSEKLIAPAVLLFSLAAALGVDRALGSTARAAAWFAAGAGAAAVACLAGMAVAGSGSQLVAGALAAHGASHDRVLAARFLAELRAGLADAAALSFVVAVTPLLRLRRPARSLAALGAACCAASVFASSSGLLHVAHREMVRGPFPLAGILLAKAGPSQDRWRVLSQAESNTPLGVRGLPGRVGSAYAIALALQPHFNSTAGIEGVAPYFSVEDPLYTAVLSELPEVFAGLFGVRFGVEFPFGVTAAEVREKGLSRVVGFWLREYPEKPRAFLVARVRTAADNPEALRLMKTTGFDPLRMAVIPGKPGDTTLSSPAVQPAVIVERPSAERMTIETPPAERTLLVVSEHFDPGWKVVIDGKPGHAILADLCALGIKLSEGSHRVELRFWPVGLTRGLWVFGLTLAGFAAAAVVRLARRQAASGRI